MSASLVGSEMCIRDRGPPDRGRFPTGFVPWAKMRSHSNLGRREAAPPVSYTHLTLPTICSV
eukprot:11597725-Alexandrium_andersonii.AAC.1